jgi:hypothetical protein
MVPKCAMSEIGEESLGLIQPVMNHQVVLGSAAEFLGTALRVFEWMGHD